VASVVADTMAATTLARASLLVVLSLVAGCGDNQDDAGARALLKRVQSESYREWQRAPGYEARRSSNAPHGGAVEIYVNDVVAELLALETPIDTWPIGSLIAKDGYSGGSLELTALMEKREDGWYWAEYDDDGDPAYSGHPDLCIDCHRSGSDFVRAFGFP
jgi:hypothetical protein